jgi:hypothetical protein
MNAGHPTEFILAAKDIAMLVEVRKLAILPKDRFQTSGPI